MGLLRLNALFLIVLVLGYASAQQQKQVNLSNTDGSEGEVAQALKQYLSRTGLYPGMSMELSVIPPPGSSGAFLRTVLQAARTAATELLPNTPAQFNANANNNMDGTLSVIHLEIHTAID